MTPPAPMTQAGPMSRPGFRSMPALTRPDGSAARALIVDDEKGLTDVLVDVFGSEGFDTRGALSGAEAIQVAATFDPDLVVLDVTLGDMDGLEVLRALRLASTQVRVLFLTARDSLEERIAGITAGGDDYVTKPFSLEEVLARARGILRRGGLTPARSENLLHCGDLTMDEDGHEVWRGSSLIELTATEFELLRYLMQHPGLVLSKAQILQRVWQYDFGGDAHVVELYISYLRKKLGPSGSARIRTVRGVGYVLKVEG